MSNSLFNQLLAKGYRITFTESQVVYSTPDSEAKTIQYTGDFNSALQAIIVNSPEIPDDDTIVNLCLRIVDNIRSPWDGPLMLTQPFDGGLIRINPSYQFCQNKDLRLTFEGVKDAEEVSIKIVRLLQQNGLHGFLVAHARCPTLFVTAGPVTQIASPNLIPFDISGL